MPAQRREQAQLLLAAVLRLVNRVALQLVRRDEVVVRVRDGLDVLAGSGQDLLELVPVLVQVDFGLGHQLSGGMLRANELSIERSLV